jgi:hypothetical protein
MIDLHPICKKHNTKMINVGFYKESPDYRKWICLKCEQQPRLQWIYTNIDI